MADNTPWTEIELEYITSIEELTLRQLSKKHKLSVTQLANKSRSGNWVEKRKQHLYKVVSDTEKKILGEQVERKAREIKIVDNAIKVYVASLLGKVVYVCKHCGEQNKVDIPSIKPKFRDIDKLIRLQHFIMGEPDSRTSVIESEEGKRFSDMSIKEKTVILNEIVSIIDEYEG